MQTELTTLFGKATINAQKAMTLFVEDNYRFTTPTTTQGFMGFLSDGEDSKIFIPLVLSRSNTFTIFCTSTYKITTGGNGRFEVTIWWLFYTRGGRFVFTCNKKNGKVIFEFPHFFTHS